MAEPTKGERDAAGRIMMLCNRRMEKGRAWARSEVAGIIAEALIEERAAAKVTEQLLHDCSAYEIGMVVQQRFEMEQQRDALAAHVVAERAAAEDFEEIYRMVIEDKCPTDEQHCTCVPFLRVEITRLQAALAKEREAARAVAGQCVYRRGDDALQCRICGRHWPSSRGAVHTEDCAVPRLKALMGDQNASEPGENG